MTIVTEPPSSGGTRVWLAKNESSGLRVFVGCKGQVMYDQSTLEVEERGVDPQVRAPLPGTVTALHVLDGRYGRVGKRVVTTEAKKMQQQLKAPIEGTGTLHV